MSDERTAPREAERRASRRGFLARLVTLGGAAGAALLGGRRRERPLREADFYRPHDLAG